MIPAATYYKNPKNREKVSLLWNRLARIGNAPEVFRVRATPENRRPALENWIGIEEKFSPFSEPSHEVAPRSVQHAGWYVNSFEDETVRGLVLQVRIPRKRAKSEKVESESNYSREGTFTRVRYLEGCTSNSDFEYFSRSSSDLHDNARDCAVGADSAAESLAEELKEWDAKYQAEQQIEEAKAGIKTDREEVKEILSERRTINQANLFQEVPFRGEVSAVCRALRSQVSALLKRIEKNRARIEKLQDDFWASAESRR